MMCRHCTWLKGTQGADSAGQDIWDANVVQSTRDVDLAQCKRTFGVQSMFRARWHSSCQPQYNTVWQLGCRYGDMRRSLGVQIVCRGGRHRVHSWCKRRSATFYLVPLITPKQG